MGTFDRGRAFLVLAGVTVIAKAFRERVVIDLELSDALVLVSSDGDEAHLGEGKGFGEGRTEGELREIIASGNVESGLVFVHRV